MKSKRNGLGLALLALSLSIGVSLVRAEEPSSSLQNTVFDPLAKVVQTIELRLAGVEASVMAFAGSFSSDHITTQRLCVSDGSGETCVTKAQLDALLKLQVQLGQAPAAADQPTVTAAEASAPRATSETVPPTEAAAASEAVGATEAAAAVTMEAAKSASETAEAVTTDNAKPATEAAATEATAIEAAATEAAATETVSTVLATEPAKESESAFTGSVASVSAEPEAKPDREEAPAPERVE
jgi:hypothetical protein